MRGLFFLFTGIFGPLFLEERGDYFRRTGGCAEIKVVPAFELVPRMRLLAKLFVEAHAQPVQIFWRVELHHAAAVFPCPDRHASAHMVFKAVVGPILRVRPFGTRRLEVHPVIPLLATVYIARVLHFGKGIAVRVDWVGFHAFPAAVEAGDTGAFIGRRRILPIADDPVRNPFFHLDAACFTHSSTFTFPFCSATESSTTFSTRRRSFSIFSSQLAGVQPSIFSRFQTFLDSIGKYSRPLPLIMQGTPSAKRSPHSFATRSAVWRSSTGKPMTYHRTFHSSSGQLTIIRRYLLFLGVPGR